MFRQYLYRCTDKVIEVINISEIVFRNNTRRIAMVGDFQLNII